MPVDSNRGLVFVWLSIIESIDQMIFRSSISISWITLGSPLSFTPFFHSFLIGTFLYVLHVCLLKHNLCGVGEYILP